MAREPVQLLDDGPSANYALTQAVVSALLNVAAAVNKGKGAGFIVSGPYGSGKTTLLMMLRELARTGGESLKAQEREERRAESRDRAVTFVRRVFAEQRVATCAIDLAARTEPLRRILQQAIRDRLPAPMPDEVDLVGWPIAVDAAVLADNYDILVVLLDEASPYLNSRSPADAGQDLAFLTEFGAVLREHRLILVLTAQQSLSVMDGIPYQQASRLQKAYRSLPLHVEGELAERFRARVDLSRPARDFRPTRRVRLMSALNRYDQYSRGQPEESWAHQGSRRARETLQELDSLYGMAQQAMSSRDWTGAEKLYAELVELDPTDPEPRKAVQRTAEVARLIQRANDALQRQDFELAYESLSRSLDIISWSIDREVLERTHAAALRALLNRAQSALSDRRLPDALKCCEKAVRLARRPGSASAANEARAQVADIVRRACQRLATPRGQLEWEHGETLRLLKNLSWDDEGCAGVIREYFDFPEERPPAAAPLPPQAESEAGSQLLPDVTAQEPLADAPLPPQAESEAGSQLWSDLVAQEAHGNVVIAGRTSGGARRLADLLLRRCAAEFLGYYVASKGIRGKALSAQVLELCVVESPLRILADLFGAGDLWGIARELAVATQYTEGIDELIEGIVVALGFSLPGTPVGLPTHSETIARLRSSLAVKYARDEILGVGIAGCDDVGEAVLLDLVSFYATVLMGSDYRSTLRERKMYLGSKSKEVEDLTFGQQVTLLENLNAYVKSDEAVQNRMLGWFERDWIVKAETHVEACLKPVYRYRNRFAHPEGIDDRILRREADEALRLLQDLFADLEKELVYPPVIAVKSIEVDEWGRRTYKCVDDRGRPERLYTDTELQVGHVYFFYPVTNPIRVDPLVVPKRERLR